MKKHLSIYILNICLILVIVTSCSSKQDTTQDNPLSSGTVSTINSTTTVPTTTVQTTAGLTTTPTTTSNSTTTNSATTVPTTTISETSQLDTETSSTSESTVESTNTDSAITVSTTTVPTTTVSTTTVSTTTVPTTTVPTTTVPTTTVPTTTVPTTTVPTTTVNDNVGQVEYKKDISFEEAIRGIVAAYYKDRDPKKMKLTVELGSNRYVYNLYDRPEYVNYPLQLGNGTYTVSMYENTTGTKYKKVLNASEEIYLENPRIVYLNSILEVTWNSYDKSTQIANDLVKGLGSNPSNWDIYQVIFDYILDEIVYDYDKINNITTLYLPDNDRTLSIGSGICYDYASLLASMLRSQDIPTKMIKGYRLDSDVYHAWNEVWLNGKWVVTDPTYAAYNKQNGLDYKYEESASDYNKIHEY